MALVEREKDGGNLMLFRPSKTGFNPFPYQPFESLPVTQTDGQQEKKKDDRQEKLSLLLKLQEAVPQLASLPTSALSGAFAGLSLGPEIVNQYAQRIIIAAAGRNATEQILAETVALVTTANKFDEFMQICQNRGLISKEVSTPEDRITQLKLSVERIMDLKIAAAEKRHELATAALPAVRAETKLAVAQIRHDSKIKLTKTEAFFRETIGVAFKGAEQTVVSFLETAGHATVTGIEHTGKIIAQTVGSVVALPLGAIGVCLRGLAQVPETIPILFGITLGTATGGIMAAGAGYHALTETFWIYSATGLSIGTMLGCVGAVGVAIAIRR